MASPLENIIALSDPGSVTAEALRYLRTNILFLDQSRNIKVIAVTSPLIGEGKTFIASNLAAATAQSDKKTLLIDGDLRHMGLSKLFGLGESSGLSNILKNKELTSGEFLLKDMPIHDIGIENLAFLPSGPAAPNPSELLSMRSMDRILTLARQEFDIVYIDISPVLTVTDPILIAKKTDGLILVVAERMTNTKAAQMAYNILKDANVHIIGTVLNRAEKTEAGYEMQSAGSKRKP